MKIFRQAGLIRVIFQNKVLKIEIDWIMLLLDPGGKVAMDKNAKSMKI